MVDIIRIPAFKDNYIWLLRKGASAVVIDPGDADPVLKILEQENLTLVSILITHHHLDHQGGVAELLKHSSATVFGPGTESITGMTHPLQGGETLSLDALGVEMQVIAVPGHTSGHLAYFGSNHLFCGDTLFTGGCGRVFEGSHLQMHASLKRLAALPNDTLIYCAHEYTQANLRFALAVEPGNRNLRNRVDEVAALRVKGLPTVPSSLSLEKATNPFLRCDEPEIRKSAKDRDASAEDSVAVFTVIREWKNAFQ